LWWRSPFVNQVGIEQIRANVDKLGIWAHVALLLLRTVSIVIPAFLSTAYSILAGTLFGFWKGIILIFIADFAACKPLRSASGDLDYSRLAYQINYKNTLLRNSLIPKLNPHR